ncbi:hypothetical protein DNK49_22435 [Azoarcus communis]|uniref:Uncharacterized protein n=1 Tax=Parazoarcus communis SWub3 = DSM 12120 TaxID=1121029 RepID=A0A323V2F5_9RHOO|nr:hypothetical protein DNK49_22435 [Azoarcus communis] [Parazoarcus communis SWub3 = DSM 12120]
MIDERFSAPAFTGAGLGSTASRDLSKQLQAELERDLMGLVGPAMRSAVAKLNHMGHKLSLAEEPTSSSIAFREQSGGAVVFVVAADIVVSVGYPDTTDLIDL